MDKHTEEVERKITAAVHDAVDYDSRKELADLYQQHDRCYGLTDEFYEALIAVAQHGARRALENARDDELDRKAGYR